MSIFRVEGKRDENTPAIKLLMKISNIDVKRGDMVVTKIS
jgi:hypothetical protein